MNKGGLYFHIPFCLKKCDYCDFCSFPGVGEEQSSLYVSALITEMEGYAERAKGTAFDTMFFGGGTPTLLAEGELSRILDAAYRLFTIENGAEVTAEANPATASKEKLVAMRRMGINRISVGVQSFSDAELSVLGRVHSADDARRFLSTASASGFDNINVDLMYGIPGQTSESWRRTLEETVRLSPSHISAYSLILEEGTPLAEKKDALFFPDEEEEDAFDLYLKETLSQNGYRHYEISNYAKEGRECKHNLHYWRNEPYLGFGVSAYSFFDGKRYGNGRSFSAYLDDPRGQIADCERIESEGLAYEWLMLRFRLAEGVPLAAYREGFGIDLLARYADRVKKYEALGLMRTTSTHLCLTEKGMRLSNAILVDFLG
jgi:oxygen-independent coproporphyrinogen-3 oxidase